MTKRRAGFARYWLRCPDQRPYLTPDRREALSKCFEAYELACSAALLWEKSVARDAPKIAEEYRRLISELEDEITTALRARPKP